MKFLVILSIMLAIASAAPQYPPSSGNVGSGPCSLPDGPVSLRMDAILSPIFKLLQAKGETKAIQLIIQSTNTVLCDILENSNASDNQSGYTNYYGQQWFQPLYTQSWNYQHRFGGPQGEDSTNTQEDASSEPSSETGAQPKAGSPISSSQFENQLTDGSPNSYSSNGSDQTNEHISDVPFQSESQPVGRFYLPSQSGSSPNGRQNSSSQLKNQPKEVESKSTPSNGSQPEYASSTSSSQNGSQPGGDKSKSSSKAAIEPDERPSSSSRTGSEPEIENSKSPLQTANQSEDASSTSLSQNDSQPKEQSANSSSQTGSQPDNSESSSKAAIQADESPNPLPGSKSNEEGSNTSSKTGSQPKEQSPNSTSQTRPQPEVKNSESPSQTANQPRESPNSHPANKPTQDDSKTSSQNGSEPKGGSLNIPSRTGSQPGKETSNNQPKEGNVNSQPQTGNQSEENSNSSSQTKTQPQGFIPNSSFTTGSQTEVGTPNSSQTGSQTQKIEHRNGSRNPSPQSSSQTQTSFPNDQIGSQWQNIPRNDIPVSPQSGSQVQTSSSNSSRNSNLGGTLQQVGGLVNNLVGSLIPTQSIMVILQQLLHSSNPTVSQLLDHLPIKISSPINLVLLYNTDEYDIQMNQLLPVLKRMAQLDDNQLPIKELIKNIPGLQRDMDSDVFNSLVSNNTPDVYVDYSYFLDGMKPYITTENTISSSKLISLIPGSTNMQVGKIFGEKADNFHFAPKDLISYVKRSGGQIKLSNILGSIKNTVTGQSFLDYISGKTNNSVHSNQSKGGLLSNVGNLLGIGKSGGLLGLGIL